MVTIIHTRACIVFDRKKGLLSKRDNNDNHQPRNGIDKCGIFVYCLSSRTTDSVSKRYGEQIDVISFVSTATCSRVDG